MRSLPAFSWFHWHRLRGYPGGNKQDPITSRDILPPYNKGTMLQRFLRLFFHLLYHSLAWAYDLVAAVVSLGRWYRWTHTAIAYLEGQRILEMGYGTGHLMRTLLEQGYEAYGLDESRQMAVIAGRRLRRAMGTVPGLTLARARGDAIPFPSALFDTVVATFPAPYIAAPETLSEVLRVLRPGGRLVILLAAYHTGRGPLERAQAWVFRITGESPPIDPAFQARLLLPFAQAGFETQIEWRAGEKDRILLVLARKPRTGS